VPTGSIVLADQLTPADTAQMDPARIAGCAAVLGGAEGHTAIMARALGLPTVLGVAGLLQAARSGRRVVVDGDMGRVIVNPTPTTLAAYERRRDERLRDMRRLSRLRDVPAVTRDGLEVTLQANVELPIEMDMVNRAGAAGIGLLRTEFMFINRDDVPSEDEQCRALAKLIEAMEGRPVTVRTLDVGGEKPAPALMGDIDPGAATALGLRGIRLSLARHEILEMQIRAILRAARHGNARILLPMVTTVGEVHKVRNMVQEAAAKLRRRRVPIDDRLPPIGVMIEVPGAALSADALARACDFFAIGSNDLTMYTLAIDRANETVAGFYDPLHPAVLRLIQFSVEAGLRGHIPVSICGEIAGDPRFTALLLGLGFREFSMTATNIPRVKQRIRDLDLLAAGQRARLIMDQVDSGRITTLLDDFNALARDLA
jgi:phosphotransferase system enzyme I (PtsI)